jgi:hypothetical protein
LSRSARGNYRNSGRSSPKGSKPEGDSEAFLDTTFLLPFFQIDVSVEGFDLGGFKEFLMGLSKIHFSELSVFEAKAKLYRLRTKGGAYARALEAFGHNLAILRGDEKFAFHPYGARDDEYFNSILAKRFALDGFDMVIMAQAMSIGTLITEDEDILGLREQGAFEGDPLFENMRIRRWKELEARGARH